MFYDKIEHDRLSIVGPFPTPTSYSAKRLVNSHLSTDRSRFEGVFVNEAKNAITTRNDRVCAQTTDVLHIHMYIYR